MVTDVPCFLVGGGGTQQAVCGWPACVTPALRLQGSYLLRAGATSAKPSLCQLCTLLLVWCGCCKNTMYTSSCARLAVGRAA
jgi:hypothetical protein